MRTLVISLVTISLVIFTFPAKTISKGLNKQSMPSNYNNEYTIKLNIGGIWYLITYSSDGYIINIVEDDE